MTELKWYHSFALCFPPLHCILIRPHCLTENGVADHSKARALFRTSGTTCDGTLTHCTTMCHRTVGRFCKWVSTSASWSCTRTSFPFQTVKAREFSSDVLISQRCRCGVGTTRSILLVHGDCMGSTCMFQSTCQRF